MANPIFGYTSPLSSFVDPKRNQLMGMAAGLAGGGLGGMWQGGMQGSGLDMRAQEQQFEQEQRNQTAEWLKANYPQYAGLPPAEGFDMALAEKRLAQSAATADPASIREWDRFSAMTPDQKREYLIMKRANPYLNLGDEFVAPDPANPGQTTGPAIPIDNFTPARDKALGAGEGATAAENIAAAQSLASKMPGLRSVVGELGQLAQTATYTTTGQLYDNIVRETGQMPSEGAIARTKYMAMVDNQVLPLLRDTFGAAFTVQEGESLRATLGAPDKSPVEKQAILEAFIEQKERDLQALLSRVPGGAAPTGGGGGFTILGVE